MRVLSINQEANYSPAYKSSRPNVQAKNSNKNIQSTKNKSTYLIGAGAVATVAVAGLAIAGHKGKGPLKKLFAQFNKTKPNKSNTEIKLEKQPEPKVEVQPEIKTEVTPEPKIEVQPEIPKPQIENTPKLKNDNKIMSEIKEYLKDKEIVERKQFRPNRTLHVLYKNTKEGEPVSETLYRQYGKKYGYNEFDPKTKFVVKSTEYKEDGKTIDSITTYHQKSRAKKEHIKYHEDGKTVKQIDKFAPGYENELLESKSFDKNGIEIINK